ncbi:MAG: glutamine synthetase III family protein [Catonella sp.]|uniref:glutamine synthetase III family protein n=1 Tax=Catonella sp. TaxID=2382125 RepID=UPI003F9F9F42
MGEEKFVLPRDFAKNVFNDEVMKDRLPSDVYKELRKTIDNGEDLNEKIARAVAHAMKSWAMERGATHYSHWFQPMTGITAEKHDSFLNPEGKGGIIMRFSGKELIKGESDASSFPSGGLRATFEARGYTAWDCTSPAFLKEDTAGVTLCIPTAFCSYTGEALDEKTPLLRSMEAISKQATRIAKLFGDEDVTSVSCSVGPEQEYFLIDRKDFLKREDLLFTGRTLFGAMPPKTQELDDHYYGNIPERIELFMKELNEECWKLGIYAKTQHNEVAPAQHEMAPVYTTANIATDHNQLVMETMKKVAKRHGLECLLHEKPFAGVNGSGKHNNWSIVTNTGKNMLDPGKTPHENVQFMLVLAAIIKAVDENATLLRLSASNPGNEHRLGADEAPPAIISIFLGDQLEDLVKQVIETGEATSSKQGRKLDIGVHSLPNLFLDATDRNRTSPFAFTGNKFEYRMVASSMSIAGANTVLNTIVANVFRNMADSLEKAEDFNQAAHDLIIDTLTAHRRIIFNGNGYSEEWVKEAAKRGLPNTKSMVEAIPALISDHTIEVFEKEKVLNRTELESRAEIQYEKYTKTINIEAKTMIDMVRRLFIPAVIKYQIVLAKAINEMENTGLGLECSIQKDLLKKITTLLEGANSMTDELEELIIMAKKLSEGKEQAEEFNIKVAPMMERLRENIDSLETIVDKAYWPVPTYSDILFEV